MGAREPLGLEQSSALGAGVGGEEGLGKVTGREGSDPGGEPAGKAGERWIPESTGSWGVPRWVKGEAWEAYRAHTGVLDVHPHGIGHHLPLAVAAGDCVISHQAEGRNELRSDFQRHDDRVLARCPLLATHSQNLPFVHDLGGAGRYKDQQGGGGDGAT